MLKRFELSDKIGEVGAQFPGALDIFLKYDIDFCCGGNRPLEVAVKEVDMDGQLLLDELNKGFEELNSGQQRDRSFTDYTASELTDYIVEVHHTYVKETLPLLSKLISKILDVHGDKHPEMLKKIHLLFEKLKPELDEHLVKEEEILFPLIRKLNNTRDQKIQDTVKELESEHESAGDVLKELKRITNNYDVPDDVCQTFAYTFSKMKELENDMYQHIHLENNILFKNLEN